MIAVVDYGASNVPSVLRGLRAVRADAMVTADPETVRRAPRVVVPGVGNFAPAMRRLAAAGLADAVREVAQSGRPVLGICLGLQLFLESSDEAPGGRHDGAARGVRGHLRAAARWRDLRGARAAPCQRALARLVGDGARHHRAGRDAGAGGAAGSA